MSEGVVAHAKIGKVTLKGGARLHIVRTINEDVRGTFADDTDWLASDLPGRMAGYAVVVWNGDGLRTAAIRAAGAPYPFDAVPEIVGRHLRNVIERE